MGLAATKQRYIYEPELKMDPDEPPTFDAHLGFDRPREKRVMIATEEEMSACKLPLEKRDYCAHLLLKVEACRADNFPFVHRCKAENHAYEHCAFEDYIMRMKEYERERRLRKLAVKENIPIKAN